jgi:hypothetical protein
MNLIKTDLLTKTESNIVNNLLLDVATEARRRSAAVKSQPIDSVTIGAIFSMIDNLHPEISNKLERFAGMSELFNKLDCAVIRQVCNEFSHKIVKN